MPKFNEELIIKYLENDFSPEEEQVLLDWLQESEENAIIFLTCKKIYNLSRIKHYSAPAHLESALNKFNQRTQFIQKQHKNKLIIRSLKYAAIGLIALALPLLFWLVNKNRSVEMVTVRVGISDSIRTVILPDGSKVWLNNGTTFTYPVAFTGKERNVSVDGEAFFDVKTDSLNPFLVRARNIAVRVYGTAFNVNTNTTDSTIETTLVRGKVAIQGKKGEIIAKLLPGQMAVYNEGKKMIRIDRVNTDLLTSWHQGLIMFDKATITEISKKIENIYNVTITLNTASILQNRLNFVFRRSQSLDTVMEMLKFVAPIQYKRYDDQLYIKLK